MQIADRKIFNLYGVLILAVFFNISLWLYSNKIYAKWTNVPDPPSRFSIISSFLGDPAFAYRAWGLSLQNFGSIGESESLKNYNYKFLGNWFFLLDSLDSHSNYVPFLASYYFSATQEPKELPPLIHYLEVVGARSESNKWRSLVEAIYLTRHVVHDTPEALRLAKKLNSLYKPPMPLWTRNMVAMVESDMGDKDAAYLLALEMLKSTGAQMGTDEYRQTVEMICGSILTPDKAANNLLCQK